MRKTDSEDDLEWKRQYLEDVFSDYLALLLNGDEFRYPKPEKKWFLVLLKEFEEAVERHNKLLDGDEEDG